MNRCDLLEKLCAKSQEITALLVQKERILDAWQIMREGYLKKIDAKEQEIAELKNELIRMTEARDFQISFEKDEQQEAH